MRYKYYWKIRCLLLMLTVRRKISLWIIWHAKILLFVSIYFWKIHKNDVNWGIYWHYFLSRGTTCCQEAICVATSFEFHEQNFFNVDPRIKQLNTCKVEKKKTLDIQPYEGFESISFSEQLRMLFQCRVIILNIAFVKHVILITV